MQPPKGAGAEILDETDLRGNVQLEFVYFGGRRVAHRVPSSGNIYYYEEDMLGSSRTIVQAGQTSPCFDADFLPFGGERDITSTCSQSYNFEGKKRDPETGNDDFGARYYASRLSRWLSPDWSAVPAPVPYANLTNPQTLNLYAMVSDNPETFADLDGHVSSDGGPYNLETADFSEGGPAAGNCDYMGGDCSQKLFDDENSGIPSWYLSEVSNGYEQDKVQQPITDNIPAGFVIEGKKTVNHGSYSTFYYQLVNSEGQPLTGMGIALRSTYRLTRQGSTRIRTLPTIHSIQV